MVHVLVVRSKMKKILKAFALIFGMLLLTLLGAIPFLLALMIGALISRPAIAYPVGVISILVLSLYSASFPETFRFGDTDLKIHDNLYIHGVSPLMANTVENLIFAFIGVRIGNAFRQGLRQSNQKRTRCSTTTA